MQRTIARGQWRSLRWPSPERHLQQVRTTLKRPGQEWPPSQGRYGQRKDKEDRKRRRGGVFRASEPGSNASFSSEAHGWASKKGEDETERR